MLHKRRRDSSTRMFKRFRNGVCFAHRSPAVDWWAIGQKSFADVEHFAVLVNDDLNVSFKYLHTTDCLHVIEESSSAVVIFVFKYQLFATGAAGNREDGAVSLEKIAGDVVGSIGSWF